MSKKAVCIRLSPADNCAVALEDLKKGQICPVGDRTVLCRQDIARGHKIALADLPSGETVIKSGYPIAYAARPIHKGDLIHILNIASFAEK